MERGAAYPRLSEDERQVRAVESLCLGEILVSKFFLSTLNQSLVHHLLESLFGCRVPAIFSPTKKLKNMMQYNWSIWCLLKWFGSTEDKPMTWRTLVEREAFAGKTKPSKSFLAFIADWNRHQKMDDIFKLAKSYLNVTNEFRSYCQFWQPQLEKLFKSVPIEKLFERFSFSAFELFSRVEMKEIGKITYSYTNSQDFETLFQVSDMWFNENALVFIQNQIVIDNFYPNCVKYESDSRQRSLIETACVKRMHFVDLVRCLGQDLMFRHEAQLSLKYAMSLDEEFAPWLFVCFVKDLESQFAELNTLVPDVLDKSTGILKDALARVLNDSELLAMVKSYTGQFLSPNDFAWKSFPKIMSSFLPHNPNPFQEFDTKPLLCVSDDDRKIDANFIWASMALGSLIRILEGADNAEELLAQNTWFLERISEPAVREAVLTDMFSVLFLKKDGTFLCQTETAERILTTIITFTEDEALEEAAGSGHLHLQVTRALMPDTQTINDVLTPKKQQLFEALERHDWTVAENIASLKQKDQDFVDLYRSVYEFSQNPTSSVSKDAAVEISASLEHNPQIISLALQNKDLIPDVQELLLLKQRIRNPMKLVRTLKSQYLQAIENKLARTSSTSWTIPSLPKEKAGLAGFSAFLSLLDVIIPSLLRGKVVETVYDGWQVKPEEVLSKLLHNGCVDEATVVAKHIGKNLLDLILTDNSYPVSVLRHFTQQIPVVEVASVFASKQELSERYEAPNKVCDRLISLKMTRQSREENLIRESVIDSITGKDRNEFHDVSIECAYRLNQNLLEESIILTLISQKLETGDIDEVGDLSFYVDQNYFSSMIMDRLTTENLDRMVKICNVSSITPQLSDQIDFLVEIRNDVGTISPLSDAFRSLILKQKYLKASKFIELMPDKLDYFSIILECLQNSDDKAGILSICPNFKERLLAQIGSRELDITDTFRNSLPPEWCYVSSPETVLNEHIWSDLYTVVGILRMFPEINCDRSFVESLEKELDLSVVVSNLLIYMPVCRDTEFVRNRLEFRITSILETITVTDPETESKTLRLITQANHAMKLFGESLITNKLDVLISIIENYPLTKYKKQYKMAKVGSDLLPITAEIDLLEQFTAMCRLWNFETRVIESIREKYLLMCYQMCLYDIPMSIPKSSCFFTSIMASFSLCHFFEPGFVDSYFEIFPPDESMLTCDWANTTNVRKAQSLMEMHKGSIASPVRRLSFETGTGRCESDERSHFYSRIKEISKRSTQPRPSYIHMDELYRIFIRNAPKNLLIRYYSADGEFKQALERLNCDIDPDNRLQIFETEIMEVAISHNTFGKLKANMKGEEKLFGAILLVAGPALRYDVEFEFGMFRNACKSALELYFNSKNTANSLIYLDMAQQALEKQSPQTEEDIRLLTGLSIQRLFNALVIDKHLDGHCGLHLFGDDKYKVAMVQILVLANELDLAITIMENYKLSKTEIGDRIVDSMLNEGETRIVSFVTSFEKKCNWNDVELMFRQVVYVMIMRLMQKLGLDDVAMAAVRAISNARFKCSLLIQFECYEEAAKVALDNNVIEYLPMIVHRWRPLQKSVLFAKCMKAIS